MAFELPPLPYETSALDPAINRENMELHYGKHHQKYISNLNSFIEDGKVDKNKPLEQIIMDAPEGPIFNNAAQVWNHTFYWQSMKPGGGGKPQGELAKAIERDFGSFENFKKEFTQAANTQFGSGWAWLVMKDGKLAVTSTSNADLPMKHGQTALLTIDVWEHAYYPTHKNQRPQYVEAFLDKVINWDFAEKNFSEAG